MTTLSLPVPAAQYVRMSDEMQQYSIENQKTAIQEYALRHGFTIVKTYADVGKSGLAAEHRAALQQLLKDVVSGGVAYKAVLVYDVSRWGRFQNNDESAHYEFICLRSGIPLHYCAEPFANDGSATSSLLKALKRSMAAEFSRELGEKVFRGKTRIVQLGYWVGGPPGYGYRRLMVSASGKAKQLMKKGEYKSLTTDRVILVPGLRKELKGVKTIFTMAAQGAGCAAIARTLNSTGFTHNERAWTCQTIHDVVTNPKYAGCNVWNRHTQRLRGIRSDVDPQFWVKKPGAFTPIIDEETFFRAQENLRSKYGKKWSDENILKKGRRLLRAKGKLTEAIIDNSRSMPSVVTVRKRFGSYREFYRLVGYQLPAAKNFKADQIVRSVHLRKDLLARLKDLFPDSIAVTQGTRSKRPLLLIDNSFFVAILLCRPESKEAARWLASPLANEKDYITLVCTMSYHHDRILKYYLFPRTPWKYHLIHDGDLALRSAQRLKKLSDFYTVAKAMKRTGPA